MGHRGGNGFCTGVAQHQRVTLHRNVLLQTSQRSCRHVGKIVSILVDDAYLNAFHLLGILQFFDRSLKLLVELCIFDIYNGWGRLRGALIRRRGQEESTFCIWFLYVQVSHLDSHARAKPMKKLVNTNKEEKLSWVGFRFHWNLLTLLFSLHPATIGLHLCLDALPRFLAGHNVSQKESHTLHILSNVLSLHFEPDRLEGIKKQTKVKSCSSIRHLTEGKTLVGWQFLSQPPVQQHQSETFLSLRRPRSQKQITRMRISIKNVGNVHHVSECLCYSIHDVVANDALLLHHFKVVNPGALTKAHH
mmetsp:Transcript_28552/g.47259  ORF Transcript_28552/g.47259 Transcript_28552/m.47259 type:complete len:304 (+) Transcript_28552:1118-2029(+)